MHDFAKWYYADWPWAFVLFCGGAVGGWCGRHSQWRFLAISLAFQMLFCGTMFYYAHHPS